MSCEAGFLTCCCMPCVVYCCEQDMIETLNNQHSAYVHVGCYVLFSSDGLLALNPSYAVNHFKREHKRTWVSCLSHGVSSHWEYGVSMWRWIKRMHGRHRHALLVCSLV